MQTARAVRQTIRAGQHRGLTTGLARGQVQANLVIIPAHQRDDFLGFCAANASACPVLAVGEAGDPSLPALGSDIDVRYDLPAYSLYRGGAPTERCTDIAAHWQADSVAIAIGCWFSMEDALLAAGVRLRHVELGIQGPLFRTHIAAQTHGALHGPLVVSMRPFRHADVAAAEAISARFPQVHGRPIHKGDPAALGITDIHTPDFGEVLLPEPGETPLFWGCGLTAVCALQNLGIDFITHAPGCMLVTDITNQSLMEAGATQ